MATRLEGGSKGKRHLLTSLNIHTPSALPFLTRYDKHTKTVGGEKLFYNVVERQSRPEIYDIGRRPLTDLQASKCINDDCRLANSRRAGEQNRFSDVKEDLHAPIG